MTAVLPPVTIKWPADPVLNDESGLPAGPLSHGRVPEGCPILHEKGIGDFQIQLLSTMLALVQEMRQQTAATNRLAQSNEALVQAMAESDGDQDAEPTHYMDGSRIR